MGLFVSVPKSVNVKQQSQVISDPIIYKNFNNKPDSSVIWFVFEHVHSLKSLKSLQNLLKNKHPNLKYAFVSSLIIKASDDDIKNNVTQFYKKNGSNLQNIIPENSKIVTFGRAIYGITKTSDIQYTDFIDEITFKNSFYSPDLKSTVYPIYPLDMWLKKDNFERIHCLAQIERCIDYVSKRIRIRQHVHHRVEDTSKFFHDFKDVKLLSLDTETSSLDWRTGRIGDITFAFNSYEGYHLFWKDIDIEELSNFLKNKKLIMMNGKFDSKFMIRNKVDRDSIYIIDIWNMMHVLNESMASNSLKAGTWRLTNFGGYDRKLDEYKTVHKVKSYIDDIPDHLRIPYAIDDAINTFGIYEEINKLFDYIDKKYPLDNGWGIIRYFYEIVVPAVNTFLDVELNGMDINYEELKILSVQLRSEITEIENELYKLFDVNKYQLNLYSTDQLGIFIEKLGWKIEDRGKKTYSFKGEKINIPLTNDDCLQRWKKQGHYEAEVLLKLREKTAMMNTFIGEEEEDNGFFQYLVQEGDRYKIYPSILPMLAKSHRSRHKSPNTGNIISHGEKAKFIRRMFQPYNKDSVFLSADASGLQLRIACLLSGDEAMKDIFVNQGGDLHSAVSYSAFSTIISMKERDDGTVDVIKGIKRGYRRLGLSDFLHLKKSNELIQAMRFKSKAISFSIIFGAVAETLSANSIAPNWTQEDCIEYIEMNNLSDSFKKYKLKSMKNHTDVDDAVEEARFITVANFIRTKFFEQFNGLANWLDQTKVEAQRNGYVRSIYGNFRRLPQLLYQGRDSDRKLIAGLLNICLNSPVQSVESVQLNRLLCSVTGYIQQNNLTNVRCFTQIHDALEYSIVKEYLKEVYNFMKKEFEKDQPEYKGIPFELEANFARYWETYKTDKWELWDQGKPIEGYIE